MKLDIIIPHYKEPWETCRYLLDSIAMQRGVPFEGVRCLIVNDGDECILDEGLFEAYPFEVAYFVKDHGGVSAARNYGLRRSKADYVMFCDADDGFLNNWGLHLVFSAMQEGFDFLCSNFVEETFSADGVMTIVKHERDLTFMHGKVYRRSFLIEHGIVFDEAMTIHEDGYFNMIAYVVSQHEGRQKWIDTPIYLWRWNDASVVRSNRKDFVLKTYDDVMLTRTGICNEMKRRGYQDEYETSVIMTVLNSYYDFQKTSFHTAENRRYLVAAEKAFKAFYKQFWKVFNNSTNQKIAEIARTARETAVSNGMLMEQQDLKSFLKHIEYEVK